MRDAAFEHLRAHVDEHGVVDWRELKSFRFRGEQVHLASQSGIFKPRQLDMPISIRTAPPNSSAEPPYPDRVSDDGYLHYSYRGTDPGHGDNVRLRHLITAGLPLIYLHGVDVGRYLVSAALLMDDRPEQLQFLAALTELDIATAGLSAASLSDAQRTHQLRLVRDRVNQASFRERVMKAYRSSCALCRIKHVELLDAAHIVPFSEGGAPIVPNGLSLCKIHHAAFDSNILGVRPDLVMEIRPDVLKESDGPMLAHGLQALHGRKLVAPRSVAHQPDRNALELRYERFRSAS